MAARLSFATTRDRRGSLSAREVLRACGPRSATSITYCSPVGGGYGDPLERDPQKVLDDVLDGFITVDHARDDYGVVLDEVDDGYGWALNPEATTGTARGNGALTVVGNGNANR